MVSVEGYDGVYVRRLSFRAFVAMQGMASDGERAGDPQGVAFACAIVAACAVSEDGTPIWADYESVANDERAMMVADVARAATDINGLGAADEGNA